MEHQSVRGQSDKARLDGGPLAQLLESLVMTHDESIALFKKGISQWNAWAQDMLSKKIALEKDGQWGKVRFTKDGAKSTNPKTQEWLNLAAVNFAGHVFDTKVAFSDTLFPGFTTFNGSVFSDHITFRGATFLGRVEFRDAKFKGCSFSSTTFTEGAAFTNTMFSDHAFFDQATFSGDMPTWFSNAKFTGASFRKATFNGWGVLFNAAKFIDASFLGMTVQGLARFDGCEVNATADFRNCTFQDRTWFFDAKFLNRANFQQTMFQSNTSFRGAYFKVANFQGIDSKGSFSLHGVVFDTVPSFVQAHFSEAPLFDTVQISLARKETPAGKGKGDGQDGALADAPENVRAVDFEDELVPLGPRYRALRRLAVQGHDHEREMGFFAAEIQAARGVNDFALPNFQNLFRRDSDGHPMWIWHGGARYWAGLFYELLSDFGRSIARPVIWWVITTCLFFILYLFIHVTNKYDKVIYDDYDFLVSLRSQDTFVNAASGAFALPADFRCVSNSGSLNEPLVAALWLSVKRGLVFAGSALEDKSSEAYQCLYGMASIMKAPIVPYSVALLGSAQAVISTVLIFLLLLGIRNQFRIR